MVEGRAYLSFIVRIWPGFMLYKQCFLCKLEAAVVFESAKQVIICGNSFMVLCFYLMEFFLTLVLFFLVLVLTCRWTCS